MSGRVWCLERKTQRRLKLWVLFGFTFFVFCLGPYLHVGGILVVEWKKIPLPFLVLYKAFPIFDRISHPFRFVVGVNWP